MVIAYIGPNSSCLCKRAVARGADRVRWLWISVREAPRRCLRLPRPNGCQEIFQPSSVASVARPGAGTAHTGPFPPSKLASAPGLAYQLCCFNLASVTELGAWPDKSKIPA